MAAAPYRIVAVVEPASTVPFRIFWVTFRS